LNPSSWLMSSLEVTVHISIVILEREMDLA
jgi:hypothetical protein